MAAIESILTETRVFPPADAFVNQANVSGMDAYQALCRQAETDYEAFWAKLARQHLDWKTPFSRTLDESNAPFYKWFDDGELNVSYNCLDRHLATRGDKTALIFEADDGTVTKVTYKQLHARVCQFANGLQVARRGGGRPRHRLHADEHRGGGGDAGLRAHRRDPFGGVRRLLRQEPVRAHRGCARQGDRSPPTSRCAAARQCR